MASGCFLPFTLEFGACDVLSMPALISCASLQVLLLFCSLLPTIRTVWFPGCQLSSFIPSRVDGSTSLCLKACICNPPEESLRALLSWKKRKGGLCFQPHVGHIPDPDKEEGRGTCLYLTCPLAPSALPTCAVPGALYHTSYKIQWRFLVLKVTYYAGRSYCSLHCRLAFILGLQLSKTH